MLLKRLMLTEFCRSIAFSLTRSKISAGNSLSAPQCTAILMLAFYWKQMIMIMMMMMMMMMTMMTWCVNGRSLEVVETRPQL